MDQQQYVCPKCQNTAYVADQFQATGGNFSKIFDVQNKKIRDYFLYQMRVHRTLSQ